MKIIDAHLWLYGSPGPSIFLRYNDTLYAYHCQILTTYLIKKSLSVDNIFVFVLIFTAFKVPALY